MKQTKKVAVVGLGYVGLPLAILAAENGYEVFGIDYNKEKVDLINKKQSPFKDKEIDKQLEKVPLRATSDFQKISRAEIVIICVPTPIHHNRLPDLNPVKNASKSIAQYLKRGQLIILESTVNPGISRDLVLPILEKESGLVGGKDFYLAHCPERINPGDLKWTVRNIPRVVGGLEEKSLKLSLEFYRSVIKAKITPMKSLEEAEAVKIVENSFRDVNIAFANELAVSFSKMDIDIINVINGASTKPFSFLAHYPGCGVGGHCIPVDPYYLIRRAARNGFKHTLLMSARKINNQMPLFTVKQACKGLTEAGINLRKARVAVLGLSYKEEVGDFRESPSLEIVKHLNRFKIKYSTFDPFLIEKSSSKSIVDAVKDCQVVIIATAHQSFTKLEPEFFIKNHIKVVVDGRNCLPKQKYLKSGLIYKGIGR